MKTGKTVEYTLVSESEANLKEGKLAIRYADRPRRCSATKKATRSTSRFLRG